MATAKPVKFGQSTKGQKTGRVTMVPKNHPHKVKRSRVA